MARNDVVLLDRIIDKARSQIGELRESSEVFELFCFDQVLKQAELSFEEIESSWTDGSQDGGIDAFFVLVDGQPATDDTPQYARPREPQIQISIFTVKRTSSFQEKPLDTLHTSLSELLDLTIDTHDLSYPYNESVIRQRELFRSIYVALADRRPVVSMSINYCSRGDTKNIGPNLKSRAKKIGRLVGSLFSNIEHAVNFFGATELLQLSRKQKDYTLKLRFVENYISREGKNYVVLSTLTDYLNFIRDEDNNLRRYLFNSNIRDYLGMGQINQDIKQTLELEAPSAEEDFWWLNNGVTILGTLASVVGKELLIENVQIVNGLQTTETIFNHYANKGDVSDDRAILLKVILAADENIRACIIKATNYQSTVNLSSLRGLDKIQRDIEEFLLDKGWFYDRRHNFYKNQGKPADRIITIPYLASAVRAVALGTPADSQKQRSKSLRDDTTYFKIFNHEWDLNVYLASLEIIRAVEQRFAKRRTILDRPPMSIVHYIGYIYVCKKLGKANYKPEELSSLAGSPPTPEEISAIRRDLINETKKSLSEGDLSKSRRKRIYEGIRLDREFIESFTRKTVAS